MFATDIVFRGSFDENCEKNCIPPTLIALINMKFCVSGVPTSPVRFVAFIIY